MKSALMWIGWLALACGLALAALSPGGWFNKTETSGARLDTPIGSVGVSAETPHSSNWPKVGYALLISGGVLVIASAVARPTSR